MGAIQQMLLGSSTGAAPPAAGLAPNAIGAGANLTFWYDGDNSVHYQGVTSTSGLASANNDPMERADSANAINRVFAGATGLRKIPAASPSNGFYYDASVTAGYGFFTKPSAGASPSVTTNVSTLCSTTNAVLIFAINVSDAGSNTGVVYTNATVFADGSGYFGLHCYESGANIVFQAYNYSGATTGEAVVTATATTGTWVIVTLVHKGGNIAIRLNGSQTGVTVSGVTDTLASGARIQGINISTIAQFATYNIAVSDANILEVERWMGNRVGVTI